MFRSSKTLRHIVSAASLLMAIVGICLQLRRARRGKRVGERLVTAQLNAEVARMEGEGGPPPHVQVPGMPG